MIEDPMSLHRTAFVNNNPVNYYDPDGYSAKPTNDSGGETNNAGSTHSSSKRPQTQSSMCEAEISCNTVTLQTTYEYYDPLTGTTSAGSAKITMCINSDGVGVAGCAAGASKDNQGNSTDYSVTGNAGATYDGHYIAASSGQMDKNGKTVVQWDKVYGDDEAAILFNAKNKQDLLQKNRAIVEQNLQDSKKYLNQEADRIQADQMAKQHFMDEQMAGRNLMQAGLYGSPEDPWYLIAKDGVVYALDYTSGAIYALADNTTAGYLNKGVEWLRGEPIYINEAIGKGMKLGDNISEDIAYFEIASGTGMLINGSQNAAGGLLACIPTGGGGCTLALVGGGQILVGATLDKHGAATLAYLMGKDKDYSQAQGSGGVSQDGRVNNPSKSESPVWKDFDNYRNGIKTDGTGSDKQYYKWDYTHNDIEVYDSRGNHLGSMDPITGDMYKPKVDGRNIKDEL